MPVEAGEPGGTLTFLFLALDSAGAKIEDTVSQRVSLATAERAVQAHVFVCPCQELHLH